MDPYLTMVSAATWGGVATDAVTVGVALAAVFVIFRGARMLLAFIRSDSGDYNGQDTGGDDIPF
jgi:hypothetical protein